MKYIAILALVASATQAIQLRPREYVQFADGVSFEEI